MLRFRGKKKEEATEEKAERAPRFRGKITRIAPAGPLIRIEMDCGFPLLGVVTKRSAQELDLTSGRQVYASFKATAIHIIKRLN